MSLMKVFSGSCLSLDDHDYAMPRLTEREHVLGAGSDFFDENGLPAQPPQKTLKKNFSGSVLDLNAEGPSSGEQTPSGQQVGTGTNSSDPTFSMILDRRRSGVDTGATGALGGAAAKPSVLLFGGTGYVGAHVVSELLTRGYPVFVAHASVTKTEIEDSRSCVAPELRGGMSVVEVDQFAVASIRDAIKRFNCSYVVHCGTGGSHESHINAARAIFDAARALNRTPNALQRIVLTGSYTAVCGQDNAAPRESGFNESDWNRDATPEKDPFAFAKVSFEKEAWRLQGIVRTDLVVILPSVTLGPAKSHEVSEAMRLICDLCKNGSSYFPFAPNMYWNFVDVRDVAAAHVAAIETPEAKNERFIVTSSNVNLAELGALIRKSHPHLRPPHLTAPNLLTILLAPLWNSRVSINYLRKMLGLRRRIDGSKAERTLKLSSPGSSSDEPLASPKVTPLEETVRDMVQDLIECKHLPTKEEAARDRSIISPLLVGGLLALAGVGLFVWKRRQQQRN